MSFVLDASVTMAWLLQDASAKDQAYALAALRELGAPDASAEVPVTWSLEVANVIARCEARGLLTAAQAQSFVGLLHDLPIEPDHETYAHALRNTLDLARRYGLSSYDASYLELALRRGLPLATFDKDLLKAAQRAGVKRLQPV